MSETTEVKLTASRAGTLWHARQHFADTAERDRSTADADRSSGVCGEQHTWRCPVAYDVHDYGDS